MSPAGPLALRVPDNCTTEYRVPRLLLYMTVSFVPSMLGPCPPPKEFFALKINLAAVFSLYPFPLSKGSVSLHPLVRVGRCSVILWFPPEGKLCEWGGYVMVCNILPRTSFRSVISDNDDDNNKNQKIKQPVQEVELFVYSKWSETGPGEVGPQRTSHNLMVQFEDIDIFGVLCTCQNRNLQANFTQFHRWSKKKKVVKLINHLHTSSNGSEFMELRVNVIIIQAMKSCVALVYINTIHKKTP